MQQGATIPTHVAGDDGHRVTTCRGTCTVWLSFVSFYILHLIDAHICISK